MPGQLHSRKLAQPRAHGTIPHEPTAHEGAASDGFELDARGYRLLRHGEEVPLERRAFDLLCYLVENPGRLISKDELLERVWQARVLGDGAVANGIAKLRKALREESRATTWIETVYGRGYRWRGFRAHSTSEADPFVCQPAVAEVVSESVEQTHDGDPQCVLIMDGLTQRDISKLMAALAERAPGKTVECLTELRPGLDVRVLSDLAVSPAARVIIRPRRPALEPKAQSF